MKDQEQKLCDVCHQRRATHHTCCGDTGETRNLCVTCFEQNAPAAELESFRDLERLIRNGKCKYCGAPAVGGCGGLGILGVMQEKPDFWCEACRLDLVEFASRPENAMPTDFDLGDRAKLEEISQQFAKRAHRQDEFMRKKISERSR